jgi:rsbT co-antagonist protein RsbR
MGIGEKCRRSTARVSAQNSAKRLVGSLPANRPRPANDGRSTPWRNPAVAQTESKIPRVVEQYESEILADWTKSLVQGAGQGGGRISESELRAQAAEFLNLFRRALRRGDLNKTDATEWAGVRDMLGNLSHSRGAQGFSPAETALFVFSLKRPIMSRLYAAHEKDAVGLADDTQALTDVLDGLGVYTTEVYQTGREEVIRRQQQDMLELSTPVVKLWDGVLALPMIGTLDSNRTQIVMESLLQRIVETGAEIAIIDITGVPTVDTLTAQHLLKTVTAARLMGAECIISGIRPQIAQTIVHLGVELNGVTTKATLADAFAIALKRLGLTVTKVQQAARA